MSSFLSKLITYIPVPKNMSFAHAGIHIGNNHIRHVFFDRSGENVKIKHFGIYDIPTVDVNTRLSERDDIVMILKKMQKEFSYKYVEVSLPEDLVYIYTAEVDGCDEDSIRTQVEFNIEENVPLKVDEAVFDITPVIFIKETNKSLVSVAVVSKKIIEDYINIFRRSSMEVVSFLVQNQALSKTLIAKNDSETYCIIAVEKRNTVVSIVSSGIVLYTSTINQSVFKDDMTVEIKEVLQELVKDIYKVVIFWLSYIEKNPIYGFKPMKSICLSSTHVDILESDFAHMLSHEFSIEVKLADVWVNIPMPKNSVPQIHKKDSYQYATAIGLAMSKI